MKTFRLFVQPNEKFSLNLFFSAGAVYVHLFYYVRCVVTLSFRAAVREWRHIGVQREEVCLVSIGRIQKLVIFQQPVHKPGMVDCARNYSTTTEWRAQTLLSVHYSGYMDDRGILHTGCARRSILTRHWVYWIRDNEEALVQEAATGQLLVWRTVVVQCRFIMF